MTDGESVRRALQGDAAALGELARSWSARVLAFCQARCGNRHVAEDLAQETLLRALRNLSTLESPERFGPWLRGIALRVCLDWLKNKQTSQVPFTSLGEGCNPAEFLVAPATTGEMSDREDELRQLMAEVEALPEQYREVLMLYYYQDVTYQDLAATLKQLTLQKRRSTCGLPPSRSSTSGWQTIT